MRRAPGLLWVTVFLATVSLYYLLAWYAPVPWARPGMAPLQLLISMLTQVLLVVLGVSVIGQYEKYFGLLMEKLHIDTVTRLPNKDVLQHCTPKTSPYVLGIINIDNFSDLGSIFGYELSDHILRNVAGHIAAHESRFGYTACHLKGKEFGILLRMHDNANEQDAYALLYSVWDALQEHVIEWDNIEIRPIYRLGGVLVRPGEDHGACRGRTLRWKTGERRTIRNGDTKPVDHERQSAMQVSAEIESAARKSEKADFSCAVSVPLLIRRPRSSVVTKAFCGCAPVPVPMSQFTLIWK